MNYRTNFVIWMTSEWFLNAWSFSRNVTFSTLVSCAWTTTTTVLNWRFEQCFRYHSISLQECFFSSSSHQNEGTKSKENQGWYKISSQCKTSHYGFRSWPYGCKVNRRIENVCENLLPSELKCYEMRFCGNNAVRVRFFCENAFCGNHNSCNIICIEKRAGRCCRLCENTKGMTSRKRLRNTVLEGMALR